MARDWEATFREWSKPSSDTEEQKCSNTEKMIRAAISESPALSKRSIDVFAQGSYRNNTNVRQDSDVDICVCCRDVFFYDLPSDGSITKSSAGFSDADYGYSQFKNEVELALVAKFGRSMVTRGNKAFDVHATSYRVDADVVPTFEHRRYYQYSGQIRFHKGTELHPDKGGKIINWPDQNYENGVDKNKATNNRFKFITRVIKRLKNEMEEKNISEAKPIPSFLIECLVWNTPKDGFGHIQYSDDVRYVLAHTFNETTTFERCKEWGEVNELKYLFRLSQPWTWEQAHAFLGVAWDYVGFK
ncbi:MAG: nucleotidyltransferase [Myxococcales bacterium]|nr:nucleotidyltransferase [Myxococcales bacterium]